MGIKYLALLVALTITIQLASSTSLGGIKHVILLVQGGRSFDHYYGTMAGVRGFHDPNVKVTNGKSVYFQKIDNSTHLLPFHINKNQAFLENDQCSVGPHNFDNRSASYIAWNDGDIDSWVIANGPYSWSYFKREDIPIHFDIADGWTIADMYSEPVIDQSCLYPNLNLVNGASEGTTPFSDILKEFRDGWQLSSGSNAKFLSIHTSNTSARINESGYAGLDLFFARTEEGGLAPLTLIEAPGTFSELPPGTPVGGAIFQSQIINAVANSPIYNETLLLISYDTTGGYGDHVEPTIASDGSEENNCPILSVKKENASLPIVSSTIPGFRVPLIAISPYTRGGRVFTEPSDVNSQILFLERWAKEAYNLTIYSESVNPWRRKYMSDLTNIFDFQRRDLTIPILTDVFQDTAGNKSSAFQPNTKMCRDKISNFVEPEVPYNRQTEYNALYFEQGYKQLRGNLTEGRYLVIEKYEDDRSSRSDVTPGGSSTLRDGLMGFSTAPACKSYNCIDERFTVHYTEDFFVPKFNLKSFLSKRFMNNSAGATNSSETAAKLTILFNTDDGYTIQNEDGKYLNFNFPALEEPQFSENRTTFNIYAVSY